ncbi:MAG TPA: hypothetical protein VKE74_04985 [Gemmataceae bacterium]|nr:hypothetical protein [Gemmataceae bacterium]
MAPNLSGLSSALENWRRRTEDWLAGVGEAMSDSAFRAWAKAEAETAANIFIPIYQQVTVVSPLTAAMLRMYLRGTTADPDLIRQVGDEIGKSATFARLAGVVRAEIDREVAWQKRALSPSELESVARRVVNTSYRDPLTNAPMYFLNSDRGLQTVIGGIGGLRVAGVSISGRTYTIRVAIADTYDFDNNQNVVGPNSDLARYVAFRTRLDQYIRHRQYRQFLWDYHQSLYLADPISRSRTFAAFMYAIEKNHLTPGGVAWEAIVPLTGEMRVGR